MALATDTSAGQSHGKEEDYQRGTVLVSFSTQTHVQGRMVLLKGKNQSGVRTRLTPHPSSILPPEDIRAESSSGSNLLPVLFQIAVQFRRVT